MSPLPEYRGSDGLAILYSKIFRLVQELGQFKHVKVIQISVENEAMQRKIENFGIDFYKTHRVYQRKIAWSKWNWAADHGPPPSSYSFPLRT